MFFDSRDWIRVARAWSFEGPCIMTELEELWQDLVLKRMVE